MKNLLLILSVMILATGAASCARPVDAKSPLHAELLQIMRERQRLWDIPPPEGTRETEVSSLVCPIVSAKTLSELQSVAGPDVEHHADFGRSIAGVATGTELWIITGDPLSWGRGILWVELAAENCRATYRPTE